MGETLVQLLPCASLLAACALSLIYAVWNAKFIKSVLLGWVLLILWSALLSMLVAPWVSAQYPNVVVYYPGRNAIRAAVIWGWLPWVIIDAVVIFVCLKFSTPTAQRPMPARQKIIPNNLSRLVSFEKACKKSIDDNPKLVIHTMTTQKFTSQNEK